MAQQKIVQTAGRDQLGEFAPEFARVNDDILFGEYGAAMTCFHCATAQSRQWCHLCRRG